VSRARGAAAMKRDSTDLGDGEAGDGAGERSGAGEASGVVWSGNLQEGDL
jgi:hypothetical protein